MLETAAIGLPPPTGGPEQLVIVVVFTNSNYAAADLNKWKTSFNLALQKKLNPLFKVLIFTVLVCFLKVVSDKQFHRNVLS